MTFEEIEKLARLSATISDGMVQPDQLCLVSLRFLYADYRKGNICIEDAASEKRKIRQRYVEASTVYADFQRVNRNYQKNILHSEECRSQLCKESEDVWDKYIIAVECISLLTGDVVVLRKAMEEYCAYKASSKHI